MIDRNDVFRNEKLELIEEVLSQIAFAEDRDKEKYEDEYIADRILTALEEYSGEIE